MTATARRRESVPLGTVTRADCLTLARSLPDGCCDLIYADPPFLVERSRMRTGGAHPWLDARVEGGLDGYLAFLGPRLVEFARLLSERGGLWVHVDPHTSHYVKVMLDTILGRGQFLNEVIWSYRSGSRPGAWFARKHDVLLWYAKSRGQHTFHRPRGGEYRTLDLKKDENGRSYKSTRNGRLYFDAGGPAIPDVWEIPILSTVSNERTGYPTQKPEVLLERIISSCTDKGDVVADFFCGSGTTLAVAQRLGRRWLGCDVSPEAVRLTRKRLEPAKRP